MDSAIARRTLVLQPFDKPFLRYKITSLRCNPETPVSQERPNGAQFELRGKVGTRALLVLQQIKTLTLRSSTTQAPQNRESTHETLGNWLRLSRIVFARFLRIIFLLVWRIG
jgi:hypothetical protein